jgi:hypothetical protein
VGDEDVGQPGQGRLPIGIQGAERLRVGVDDADQDLADHAAADRAQLLALVEHLRLLEDVEPQRCLAGPATLGEPELRRSSGW